MVSIYNSKGRIFCEVAASLDYLFEGPGGYEIKKGWWKKKPKDFQDQVKRYCTSCSGALPMKVKVMDLEEEKDQLMILFHQEI